MSRHKTGYFISYHGILCHDMSYVTTITASLVWRSTIVLIFQGDCTCISCNMGIFVFPFILCCGGQGSPPQYILMYRKTMILKMPYLMTYVSNLFKDYCGPPHLLML